ncbi:MAG: ATP-binding cassette domain-containing protein [Bacteroidetes bacterium]|nr:ATP-binding cassette domain-containing protein [Bacteroidota bacterium]
MEYIFKAENITKNYTGHKALDNVSISVPKQSVYGLLGPNGAGKTTLIRIINQIIGPDEGKLFFDGEKLKPEHVHFIGYLPEERGLYKKMKIGEQALYLAQLKNVNKHDAKKKLKVWFEKFDLLPWWDKKVEELSKGMAQKMQFIITILHQPKLLIFDEPFSGFDPINVNLLKEEILNLRNNGATIIFSTHNMSSVEEICDDITLINKSRIILEGNVKEIRKSHSLGIYCVELEDVKKPLESMLGSQYNVSLEGKSENLYKYRIRKPDGDPSNNLLKSIMEAGRVISFQEVLPSMNDIFIKNVTGKYPDEVNNKNNYQNNQI